MSDGQAKPNRIERESVVKLVPYTPLCPVHSVAMLCKKSEADDAYYRCPIPGCGASESVDKVEYVRLDKVKALGLRTV